MTILQEWKKIPLSFYCLNLLAAYLLTCTAALLSGDVHFDDIAFADTLPVGTIVACTLFLWVMLTALEIFCSVKGLPVFAAAVLYCLIAVCIHTSDVYFTVSCVASLGFLTYHLVQSDFLPAPPPMSNKALAAFILIAYVIISGFTAYANVLRYESYYSSTFDLGIFAQMYENMAKTGRMEVSCERNVLDNHLLRHFSPIFYILLPFYWLFRTPSFLVAIQPMIVLSGVLPLTLIGKRRHLSNGSLAVMASVFLCYPTFTAACYYDFHENLFLTPLLLWLLYFLEQDNTKGIVISSILTAMIKEDAGLYLCCIGCYLIFYKCRIKQGLSLTAFALTVFFAATSYISAFGDSTLSTQHYSNLIPPGGHGMAAALRTILLDPGFLLTQLLSAEKITFLLQMLLPLMLLPLRGKKLPQLFLALPLCAVSLITTYSYQFNIDFQYSFGTGALLLYMALCNFSHLPSGQTKKTLSVMAVLAALLLMLNSNVPKYRVYRDSYQTDRQAIRLTDEVIDGLDTNDSVTASTFLVPKLYRHREVYLPDNDCILSDYVLIDARFREEHTQAEQFYRERGYTAVLEQGYVILLKKPAKNSDPNE